MLRHALFVFAFAIPLGGAFAEDGPSGVWEFRTDIRDKGCAITGVMTIGPLVPGETQRSCEFVSAETCGPEDPEPTMMEQSCSIVEKGDFYLISSTVEQSLTPGRGIEFYMADNFTVRPTSASTMSGTWYDEIYADTVEFWRSRGGATS